MYDGDKEADPQVWGHVVVRGDGDEGAGPRVRGHVAAREPTAGPRTRDGTGARPAGGRRWRSQPTSLGTRYGTRIDRGSGDMWRYGSLGAEHLINRWTQTRSNEETLGVRVGYLYPNVPIESVCI
jgi:hypothetical protein